MENTSFRYCPKAKYKAEYIYAIKTCNMNHSEQVMISTLQGIVSNKTTHQIFIDNERNVFAFSDLQDTYGVPHTYVDSANELLNIFKEYIDGYILYSFHGEPNTDSSINVATTLCGLKNAIAVEASMESAVAVLGIDKIMDARGKDDAWVFENYWSQLRHNLVIEIRQSILYHMRDYAVMSKALIFFDGGVTPFRDKIMSALEDDAVCLGWSDSPHGEFGFIEAASMRGVLTVPNDWSSNLSLLSGFDSISLKQRKRKPLPKETDVHYLTILMSDGDNQQWVLNGGGGDARWFGSMHKGAFPMGWAIPPLMWDNSPTVLQWLYERQSQGENQDQFVIGPSGAGYMYPSRYPENELDVHVKRLNAYMEKTDTRAVAIIDDNALEDMRLWDKYTSQPNVDGLFYLEYCLHSKYSGKVIWSNGKPVISCTDLLWEGLEEEAEAIQRINSRPTDISSPEAYTMFYIHAWSKNMDDVRTVVNNLGPKVRIVTPEDFIRLLKKNVKHQ